MLLLDTCALIWLVDGQEHLTNKAKKAIENNANNLYISAISAFEISLKYNKGLLGLPLPPLQWFRQALQWHNIVELPVDSLIAVQSTALPKIHHDPADRIIIATAIENQMTILTADKHISSYCTQVNLKVLW